MPSLCAFPAPPYPSERPPGRTSGEHDKMPLRQEAVITDQAKTRCFGVANHLVAFAFLVEIDDGVLRISEGIGVVGVGH